MPAGEKYIIHGSYGLVVCGGNSSRMGTDKSMLRYYEKPQRYHIYDMLEPLCEQAFISCNEEQAGTIEDGYALLTDDPSYTDIGPVAALLTAFKQFPKKNILFIGCDYPFLTSTDLQQFSTYCKEGPAAFYNEKEELYEPLLAWYPYRSFNELKKMYEAKHYSLQHFLRDNKTVKFYPENKSSMISVDTPEAFIDSCNLVKLP